MPFKLILLNSNKSFLKNTLIYVLIKKILLISIFHKRISYVLIIKLATISISHTYSSLNRY